MKRHRIWTCWTDRSEILWDALPSASPEDAIIRACCMGVDSETGRALGTRPSYLGLHAVEVAS